MINSVYGVASLISRGAEPQDIIDVMKGKGREWESISRFMLNVANQCTKLYHHDAAERVLNLILELSREKGDKASEGDCLTRMGRLMWSKERGMML